MGDIYEELPRKSSLKAGFFTGSALDISQVSLIENDEKKKKKEGLIPKKHVLVITAMFSRIGCGLFLSIHGPTLIALANNVHSSIGDVSWLFAAKSLGTMIGGLATLPMMRRVDNMFAFSISSLILCGTLVVTPWLYTYQNLIFAVSLGGVGYGYLTAGLHATLTQVLNDDNFRELILAYHYVIAIGAFLAPFLAVPFLNGEKENKICFFQDQTPNSSLIVETMVFGRPQRPIAHNPIIWTYLICGFFIFVGGLIFLYHSWTRFEIKLRRDQNELLEEKFEEIPEGIPLLSIFMCIFYFFSVAGDTAYHAFIYSISICSNLKFQPFFASLLNSLYWLGFGLGRFSKIISRRNYSPGKVIIFILLFKQFFLTFTSLYGESVSEITWVSTFAFGFCQATLFFAATAWASKYIDMVENYTFIFSIGQSIGPMAILPISGCLFDIVPFYVMYLVLGCAVSNTIVCIFMFIESARVERRKSEEKDKILVNNAF